MMLFLRLLCVKYGESRVKSQTCLSFAEAHSVFCMCNYVN